MSSYDPDEAIGPDETAAQHAASDTDYTSADYDEFLKDAEKDDRIGDHDWLVSRVTHDFWQSGDPRIKIQGTLLTAGGQTKPKADLTVTPPPTPDWLKENASKLDTGMKKAIAGNVNIYRQLATHYGTTPEKITEGDVFRVKVIVTKKNATEGSQGFARVVAFKSKDQIGAAGTEAAGVPF